MNKIVRCCSAVAGTTVEFYDTEVEGQLARDFDRLRGRLLGLIDVASCAPSRPGR